MPVEFRDGARPKEVTLLLQAAATGDSGAINKLFGVVYPELQAMAKGQLAHDPIHWVLQTGSLVNEAYLRLVPDEKVRWENRRHFFGAAANAMWRIRIERARKVKRELEKPTDEQTADEGALDAQKKDNRRERKPLEELAAPPREDPKGLEDLRAAIEKLRKIDDRKAEVVNLRFILGKSVEQTAEILEVSPRTVELDWKFARAWLHRELGDTGTSVDVD